MHTRTPSRVRLRAPSLHGRIAAALLLVLHSLLGAAAVVADARPAAGHRLVAAADLQSAPASAADPADGIASPHHCPLCGYIAAQSVPAPLTAIALGDNWIDESAGPAPAAGPSRADALLRPTSRAPPVL